MGETYIVDLDLERLRAERSQAEHRSLTDADVRRWLISSGLYPRIDGLYLCEEAVLARLAPQAVLAKRPVGYLVH